MAACRPSDMSARVGAGGCFAAGSRMANSLPLPGPSLSRRDAAAVHLDQLLDHREPDPQPPFGAGERAVPLGEELEHLRQLLGRDADAVVPDADDDLVRLRLGPRAGCAPRSRCTWPRCSGGSRPPARAGSGRLSPRAFRGRWRARALLPLLDERPDRGTPHFPESASRPSRRSRSSILPRVMRETSEQVVDEPRLVPNLPGDDRPSTSRCAPCWPVPLVSADRVADGRERVPQLVGEHGQELVLALGRSP